MVKAIKAEAVSLESSAQKDVKSVVPHPARRLCSGPRVGRARAGSQTPGSGHHTIPVVWLSESHKTSPNLSFCVCTMRPLSRVITKVRWKKSCSLFKNNKHCSDVNRKIVIDA